MKDLKEIVEPLIQWFRENKRDLPWRQTKDPYAVWVSEIMLQQTRVEAVKPYYIRFLQTLPTVKDLANADEEVILKLWEGLGYYSRVRNMQKAAMQIMEDFSGVFPANQKDLLSLKGIGSYTAGAVGSIAFGLPIPAVDGNVLRVMSRITADASDISLQITKKEWESRLAEIMPQECAGDLNQALMELGAIVCVPNGEPLCGQCPWHDFCETRKKGLWQELPVKKKAKARRIEDRTVLVIRDGERVVLKKRPKRGLLAGLYEFPNELGKLSEDEALHAVQEMNLHPMRIQKLEDAKHIFSHVEWRMQGYMVEVDSLTREEAGLLFVEAAHSEEKYPIPAAFAAYTKYMNIRLGNERFEDK